MAKLIAEDANIRRQSRARANALRTTRSTCTRFAKRRRTRISAAYALRNSLHFGLINSNSAVTIYA